MRLEKMLSLLFDQSIPRIPARTRSVNCCGDSLNIPKEWCFQCNFLGKYVVY